MSKSRWRIILSATALVAACSTMQPQTPVRTQIPAAPELCQAAVAGTTLSVMEIPGGITISFLGPAGQEGVIRERLQQLVARAERQPVRGVVEPQVAPAPAGETDKEAWQPGEQDTGHTKTNLATPEVA